MEATLSFAVAGAANRMAANTTTPRFSLIMTFSPAGN